MDHAPRWAQLLITWLLEQLSENDGILHTVESLVAGTGFQETWTAIISDSEGRTSRWFLRKVFFTARWCTISGIYSALGIPTIKPIPFDDTTLVYPAIEGTVLKDYRPHSETELLLLADTLGEAFIPPLLTELGDRRPQNMILSKSLDGNDYCITHIDFDKSLYIPWYNKIMNRHRFIKHVLRRITSPWIDQLDSTIRSVFIERFTDGAEKYLQGRLKIKIQTPGGLKHNYLRHILPSGKINLPWDWKMLRFAYKQLAYWGKVGAEEIKAHIARLL